MHKDPTEVLNFEISKYGINLSFEETVEGLLEFRTFTFGKGYNFKHLNDIYGLGF